MEKDKNIFPKIDLFPRVTAVARFITDRLKLTGSEIENTGGGPLLDELLMEEDISGAGDFKWYYPNAD